ncbi:pyridoxamine 5'-phosphate oxidase family protein [Stenotrophomonas sp. MMGLT7]|uniref:pyridoxamine 5'-phosphate oxidase family protein n=1 Tax=Stenotrophomonas sp. MMGLT7 TaxID=2901227 RepID=UPI001E4464DD|nr:pyridoxamine 5'-phosphate oxidase family protein [Stenotrophomonas sp. MMGLT7]MCD7098592.1 hypothetical protein [Stenotrophomonas sp. MMGLT7]
MKPLPAPIIGFLARHRLLSLAVCYGDVPWAANAFFAFDEQDNRLVMLSGRGTRHSEMLLANRYAAGTIAGEPRDYSVASGLQFYGPARILEDPREREAALAIYRRRFPRVLDVSAPAWEIKLLQVKYVDDVQGYGTRLLWDRHGN